MDLKSWKEKNKNRRNYTHFDTKLSLYQVWDYISLASNIEKHGFYPFIHYTKQSKKYSKTEGVKYKNREICYSSHIDRYIYQYYSYQLNEEYNKRVIASNINENVIGYRDVLHKNSIHFAKNAFDFIKNQKECYVIIGDFTNFFDCLDHHYLKERLCDLLNTKYLSSDVYAVYKNITKYSKWELASLLEHNNLKNTDSGIAKFNKLERALSLKDFKRLKNTHITPKNSIGIPQGSAISAVLSNIYMLKFDEEIYHYVKQLNGLYMRYSDDFIIILPTKSAEEFSPQLLNIQKSINLIPNLILEKKKTQIFKYANRNIVSVNEEFLENVSCGKNYIDYLGFSFDGTKVRIRAKTETKYYYRLYRKTKTIIKNKGITKNNKRISNRNLYAQYSIKGAKINKGNFITYVKKVETVFENEKGIGRISKVHMQKIRKQLNKV